MATTGYTDTFGRTVSGGFGTADTGQAYTLLGVASQFSVAPNTGSIAISSAGDKAAYVDRLTSDIDITASVALSAIPATNLATVGFISKLATVSNYYNATMMVAAGGAVSLRFSKVIAGGLTTISTTAIASITYVANTVYKLRYQCYWSNLLQTNVMNLKVWLNGFAEPTGWMASTTDGSLTQYTSGTSAGVMARDESSSVGSITAKIQNVVAKTYSLPMPASTDPMCADPASNYPKITALQNLASATDSVMASFDPLANLANLFPRVRVSATNLVFNSSTTTAITFGATEFNVGTPTNLGYNPQQLYLPVGIWMLAVEIRLAEATSASLLAQITGGPTVGRAETSMRSNAVQLNDQGVGGCGHISSLTYVTDPATPNQYGINLFASGPTYTIAYCAFSAIKISDYFT